MIRQPRRSGPRDDRTAPTFSSYCVDTYTPKAGAVLAPGTYANRKYQIATLIEHFGDLPLDEFTDDHLREFRRLRAADKVGPATVNDEEKVLRAILNHAKGRKQFPVRVPTLESLPVPNKRENARAWTSEEIGRLFAATQKNAKDILPMVVFGLNAGCRKTEIIRLRWKSVHWDTGQISIEPNAEWRPKSNKARTVPLSPTLRPWLERLRVENDGKSSP